jgi:hypothetical protein
VSAGWFVASRSPTYLSITVRISTLLLERTPDSARGRVLAALNGMTRGSTLGAIALGDAAGSLLGPRTTFTER